MEPLITAESLQGFAQVGGPCSCPPQELASLSTEIKLTLPTMGGPQRPNPDLVIPKETLG